MPLRNAVCMSKCRIVQPVCHDASNEANKFPLDNRHEGFCIIHVDTLFNAPGHEASFVRRWLARLAGFNLVDPMGIDGALAGRKRNKFTSFIHEDGIILKLHGLNSVEIIANISELKILIFV